MAKRTTKRTNRYKGKGFSENLQRFKQLPPEKRMQYLDEASKQKKFDTPLGRLALSFMKSRVKRDMKGRGLGPIPRWAKEHNIPWA